MKILNIEKNITGYEKLYKTNTQNNNIIKEKMEEIFIKMLLKNIRLTSPKNELFNENKNDIYHEIYDQTISEIISKRGINLINMIKNQKKIVQ
ncbi:hypothetical protein RJI84_01160 [Buchnera aphidicola (Chaitoregma tattakana)]|uniref:rod-binding protein n=1 Tax=Buchnera aphidicola TaxID=9 RepID=UPI0031B81E10